MMIVTCGGECVDHALAGVGLDLGWDSAGMRRDELGVIDALLDSWNALA